MANKLWVKRIYDPPAAEDGKRILVDRIWPRGLAKGAAAIDLWMKDVAPSTELRKWYNHDPDRWPEFRERYEAELNLRPESLAALRAEIRAGPVTLLFGARDIECNNAVVLAGLLR